MTAEVHTHVKHGTGLFRKQPTASIACHEFPSHSPADVERDDTGGKCSRQNGYTPPQQTKAEPEGPSERHAGADREQEPGDENEGRQAEDQSKDHHACERTYRSMVGGRRLETGFAQY